MIKDPPLLTIRRNFPRPKAEEVKAFADAQTGHVIDAMNGRGSLDYRIKASGATGCNACRRGDDLPLRPRR